MIQEVYQFQGLKLPRVKCTTLHRATSHIKQSMAQRMLLSLQVAEQKSYGFMIEPPLPVIALRKSLQMVGYIANHESLGSRAQR